MINKVTKTSCMVFWMMLVMGISSCDKSFLDAKPSKSLLVPETLDDFRNLMDNATVFNFDPAIAEIAGDDFQVNNTALAALYIYERNMYTWEDDLYGGASPIQWTIPYKQVLYSNVVLAGLDKILNGMDSPDYRQIKGTALFFRSIAYYNLLQTFAAPYNIRGGNENILGIILKETPNVNEKLFRSNLQSCYDRVIQDLTLASELLENRSGYKTRPSKTAALELLSRVNLAMGQYDQARIHAEKALSLQGTLLDYNGYLVSSTKPFPVPLPSDNAEVIFFAQGISGSFLNIITTNGVVNELYDSYAADDLRKGLYFRDRGNSVFTFKGSYSGALPNFTSSYFTGLATDELYLNKSESLIRLGRVSEGIEVLNSLLIKRFKTGKYIPIVISDQPTALLKVLLERRKSLLGRMIRWGDLRRLNQDDLTKKTIIRLINDPNLRLEPGDPRYVFPFPDAEVRAGIEQNPR